MEKIGQAGRSDSNSVDMRRKRKEAEEALKASETSYRRLFESAKDGILLLDADTGQITNVNPYLIEMLGYSHNEFLGKKLWEIGLFKHIAENQAGFQKLQSEEYIRYEDLPLETKEGRHIDVEFVSNVYSADHKTVIQCNIRDITGRKRAEEERWKYREHLEELVKERTTELRMANEHLQQEITERKLAEVEIRKLNEELKHNITQLEVANKELEVFSYSISHDLRAPLRSLDGFSQVLFEDYANQLDEQGKDSLQRIRKASQRMAELIDALLMLSRMTRKEMHYETVDLSTLAQATLAELRQTQPKRQIEVVIEEGLVVKGDPQLLRVVIDNLLANAWKYTSRKPEARIEVGAMRQEDGKRTYFVRDNGAGFDMAFADKLFKAFQRLHTPNEFPGVGIGLATVQRIIHRHGGRIWAEGEVEKGATFYFTLP